MKIQEPFIFDANGKAFQVSYEVDLYSLSFSLVCPPSAFKAELIKFFEERSSETEITVRVLVLEENKIIGCIDTVPLQVYIKPLEKDLKTITESGDLQKNRRIFKFQQFIDQLCANGEL